MHTGVFCQFPFMWIYYCHSSKSTGKGTGKTHLCAMNNFESKIDTKIFTLSCNFLLN